MAEAFQNLHTFIRILRGLINPVAGAMRSSFLAWLPKKIQEENKNGLGRVGRSHKASIACEMTLLVLNIHQYSILARQIYAINWTKIFKYIRRL